MPYDQVMHKFKHGALHSGSKSGPEVTNPHQAIAIMLSEKQKADEGDEEYQSSPSKKKKSAKSASSSSSSRAGFAGIRKPTPQANDDEEDGY